MNTAGQPSALSSAPAPADFSTHPAGDWTGRLNLYSVSLTLAFMVMTLVTSVLWLLTPLAAHLWFHRLHQAALAGMLICGLIAFVSLFILHRFLVPPRDFLQTSLRQAKVHLALTAFNDQACIAQAVQDFKASPYLHKVIVVENNSRDRTRQCAIEAGADSVITENVPGYGSCCQRALSEAAVGLGDDDVVILCEGDLTFSAADVPKFLAYLENAHLVLGTRATQELRQPGTQMDWLLNPGNQIVAKLIQCRFWGTRLTDCGCTYRAMRAGAYRALRHRLNVQGNHFSPHMYMEALKLRMRVIEIPVVFRQRAGESKGVGSNKIKATKVALRMLGLLYRA